MWGMFASWVPFLFKSATSILIGGSLEDVLRTIDRNMSEETKREEIKAEITKVWIDRQSQLLVGRTWWFQLFFVIPAGVYWFALILSQFPFLGWEVYRMPGFAEEVFLGIVSALFMIDGGKAVFSKFKK